MPADGEIDEICSDPILHAEARLVAPHLRALAQGAGDEGVRRALQSAVLVFGVSAAAETKPFWAEYFKALRDVPMEALEAAVSEYIQQGGAEFFPKPGPLKALAFKHAEPLYKAAYRAKRAADSLPRSPIQRISGEQLQELRVLLGGKPKAGAR